GNRLPIGATRNPETAAHGASRAGRADEEFEFVMPAAPVQQRPEAANWGGLFLLVVGLNLLLLLPFGRPFFFVRQSRPRSGHRYDGIVGFAARNNFRQLQTLACASTIPLCPGRHDRRPFVRQMTNAS